MSSNHISKQMSDEANHVLLGVEQVEVEIEELLVLPEVRMHRGGPSFPPLPEGSAGKGTLKLVIIVRAEGTLHGYDSKCEIDVSANYIDKRGVIGHVRDLVVD